MEKYTVRRLKLRHQAMPTSAPQATAFRQFKGFCPKFPQFPTCSNNWEGILKFFPLFSQLSHCKNLISQTGGNSAKLPRDIAWQIRSQKKNRRLKPVGSYPTHCLQAFAFSHRYCDGWYITLQALFKMENFQDSNSFRYLKTTSVNRNVSIGNFVVSQGLPPSPWE